MDDEDVLCSAIAAVDSEWAIGRSGRIPWSIPGDLRRFRRLTMGAAVVMGRKTFESLRNPLDGRTNVVVSRRPDFSPPGVSVAGSFDEAAFLARSETLSSGRREWFVIGGGDAYAATAHLWGRVHLTRVEGSHRGDAFFPGEALADGWAESSRKHVPRAGGVPAHSFLVLDRVPAC